MIYLWAFKVEIRKKLIWQNLWVNQDVKNIEKEKPQIQRLIYLITEMGNMDITPMMELDGRLWKQSQNNERGRPWKQRKINECLEMN